jgi:hypothetical protein
VIPVEVMTHEQSRHGRAPDIFAVVALVVTFALRYGPFVTSHLLFGPFLDNVHVYGPIFAEVSRLSLSGAVPYYLPDIGTGFPVFESPHFSILYPFYFLGLINYGGPLSSLYTLTYLTLSHIFIFYVNLYVLLRCGTVPPWAAYIGASVGMLARNTELYASWITITASYAWLPLVLAGGVLLLRFPGESRGILVLSVAAGLLALASASQPVIHTALSCVMLFAAGIGWLYLQRRFKDLGRVAWSLAVCSGIALGLAAAAILPMYIATGEMIRHVGAGAAVIGHEHIPWKSFNLSQLTLSQAPGILIRPTWIHIVGSPYVGPLGVIGTLLAGIYFRRLDSFLRALAVAFGVIGLYGLLSGFGTNLGLAYVNFHLPFINRIREGGRHLVLFVIGVSFLSGLGYSLLTQRVEQYKQRGNISSLIAPAVLGLAFAGIIIWELLQNAQGGSWTGFWMLVSAPIMFLIGRVWKVSCYKAVVLAAAFVSTAALVIPVRGIPVSRSDFEKPINLLSHRVLQSVAPNIDRDYRVDFRDKAFSNRFWAMNASYHGMKSFYNQLPPQPYDQFRFSNLTNVPHLREMMGTRYVLCGPNEAPIDRNAKEILETEGYWLYENPNPMGQFTLVHRVAGSANNEAEFINIIKRGFDYDSEAYVTPHDLESVRQFFGNRPMSARPEDVITNVINQPNRSYSRVESNAASLLILNEWFTAAWKVRVNGVSQPVLRVNQWQVGALLPAGKNDVEFEYGPTLFRVLMILNRITVVLILGFLILLWYRNRSVASSNPV